MIPVFISVLFGCLSLLLQWLVSNRGKLSERQRVKVQHALSLMQRVQEEAGVQGLVAWDDPEEEPMMAGVGWDPLGRVWAMAGAKIGARVRELFPDPPFPGTPDEQNAFFAEEVRKVANS